MELRLSGRRPHFHMWQYYFGSYLLVLVDPFQKTEIGEKEENEEKKKREKKRKKRERRKEKRRKVMASYIEIFGVGRKLIKDLETHWFISI